MSAIPMFGNALHSRHIRGAYNRRRDEEDLQKSSLLKRSHSSHARLNDEKCDVKHHHHQHGQHEHVSHHQHRPHHLHERPIFALSLDQERDALNNINLPGRQKHTIRSNSAPELGFEEVVKSVKKESESALSPLPQPDQWRWDFGSAFRRFDTFAVNTTGKGLH